MPHAPACDSTQKTVLVGCGFVLSSAPQELVLPQTAGLEQRLVDLEAQISRLTATELEKLLPELSSGMVPKMEGCLYAVRNGVHTARVIDGRVQHSILLEIFTDEGIGTMVVPDPDPDPDPGLDPDLNPGPDADLNPGPDAADAVPDRDPVPRPVPQAPVNATEGGAQ